MTALLLLLLSQASVVSQQGRAQDGGIRPWPVEVTSSATDATLSTLLTFGEFTARLNTLGRKSMAGSAPVVIAWDQAPVPTYFTTPQAVTVASLPVAPVTAQGPDGGTTFDVSGSSLTLGSTVVYVNSVAPPVNPFLPRCNPVRRTGCQP